MILAWMLFATAIGTLVSLAALAGEHVASAGRWPRRAPWLVALAASAAWPLIAAARSFVARGSADTAAILPALRVSAALEQASVAVTRRSVALAGGGDRLLLLVWLALSAFLLVRLALRVRAIDARRAGWRRAIVDDVAVRLAPDAGPAVVGFRAMDIVLPEWILQLDAPLRALVLRHEQEHRRAGDPLLLLAASVVTALVPWNPAVWWQARRLRLALEMDCDARVLAVHPSHHRYGLLLLTIAQRRSVTPPLLAPALSEPASDLERRIVAMRMLAHRISGAKLVAALSLGVAAIAVACAVDAPTRMRASAGSRTAANQPYFEFQVAKQVLPLPGAVPPRYPEALLKAGTEGQVLAQFVVDVNGRPEMDTFKALQSTDPLFTQAVRSALAKERFAPAEVQGRTVRQVVQMPFVFSLSPRPR